MTNKEIAGMTVAVAAAAVKAGAQDAAAVDKAFETLKTYDWGDDPKTLKAIDEAIIATHGDAAARAALEGKLVGALTSGISRSAVDYVCRRLRIVGTAQSVEALAALLPDENTSHIARYALERIPNEQALAAIRDALPKVDSKLKSGMIGSLGTRRDTKSIPAIAKCLGDSNVQVGRAAAQSLGLIGTPAAAKELTAFAKKAPANLKIRVDDACLVCAEKMAANGQKTEALALYRQLNTGSQPNHVRVAAMKGMLAAATK